MTALYNMVFVLQFLAVLGIVGVTLYNVFTAGKMYSARGVVLFFAGLMISWAVGMVTFLQDPEELLFLALFRLETWLMLFGVMLFIVQLFLVIKEASVKPVEAYTPMRGK